LISLSPTPFIRSAGAQQVVDSQITEGCGGAAAWIGLGDEDDDDVYNWANGEPVDFTVWLAGDLLVSPSVATFEGTWFSVGSGTADCAVCMGYPTATAGICETCPVADF
jgi:hypothetical protein